MKIPAALALAAVVVLLQPAVVQAQSKNAAAPKKTSPSRSGLRSPDNIYLSRRGLTVTRSHVQPDGTVKTKITKVGSDLKVKQAAQEILHDGTVVIRDPDETIIIRPDGTVKRFPAKKGGTVNRKQARPAGARTK